MDLKPYISKGIVQHGRRIPMDAFDLSGFVSSLVTTQTTTLQPIPMDVFLIAGQSNAMGVGTNTASPNPSSNTVYQYLNGALVQVTDEVGNLPGGRGSAWPSFGITYNNMTGRRICFVQTAADGTGQVALSDTGYGNWSPTGTLYSNSVTQLQNALAAITAAGYQPKLRGILWMQGENDGNTINAGTITSTDYQNGLVQMIANYRTQFGSNLPFYIFRIGTRVGYPDTGFAAVRAAQVTVANNDSALTKIVFYNAIDFPSRGLMSDAYHFVQAGYNEMGNIGAENVVSYQYAGFQKQGLGKLFYNGFVGIGTDTPSYDLHIVGATDFAAWFQSTINAGNGGIAIENTNTGSAAAAGIRFYNNSGLNGQLVLGSSSYAFGGNGMLLHSFNGPMRVGSNSGNLELFTGSGGPSSANVKASLRNNGNFIIGANAPAITDNGALLQVAGNITTIQPSANGAGAWKLGKKVSATVTLATDKYIEVDIDGVIYKLATVN